MIEMAKFFPQETVNYLFSLNAMQNSVKDTRLGVRQALTSYVCDGKILKKPQGPFSSIVERGWRDLRDRIVIKIKS